uniref:Uncharacterized protein n=1 Tax=Romanomermis culicivorax TaxID=13658 RepID=A0A915K589_ROMCU
MTNRAYALLSSFLSFYFPLAIIICMYFAIWRKTQGRSQKFFPNRSLFENHSRVIAVDRNTYWSEYQTFITNQCNISSNFSKGAFIDGKNTDKTSSIWIASRYVDCPVTSTMSLPRSS